MSPRTRWWPVHCRRAVEYIMARRAGGKADAFGARQELELAGREWAEAFPRLPGHASALAADHAEQERRLVDASHAGDVAAIRRAAARLQSGARDMALMLGRSVRGFPEGPFESLLSWHVAAVVKAAKLSLDDAWEPLVTCEIEIRRGGLALGVFMAEWM